MDEMNMELENTFDFIINEEDEVMLLLYVGKGEPKNATIEIDTEDQSAILYRNNEDSLRLDRIPDDVFDSLQDTDTLLVCELSREDNEEDTKIVYAYEADISM
jgi:hypothetical protein